MERSPSETALSQASTQYSDDEEPKLDDTQDEDSAEEESRKTHNEIVRKNSRSRPHRGIKQGSGFPMASGAMNSSFSHPPPLMGCNPNPYALNQTPSRNTGSFRPRQNRNTSPRGGFSSVRRPHNADKSSPEANSSDVFATGGRLGAPFSSPMPDDVRLKPLSRPSPFGAYPGPRPSQRSNRSEAYFPLVFLAPGGFISVQIHPNLVIDTSVDHCLRVTHYGQFAAFIDHRGTTSSIVHPHARVLHQLDSVSGRFTSINDKMVIFGRPGVLFSMDHLRESYLISSSHRNHSPVAVERLEFPKMKEDLTLMQFYREAQMGEQFFDLCREIIDEARYDRKPDGTLVMTINDLTIRHTKDGDLHVDARPSHIKCTADGSLHVRTAFIDTNIQSPNMAYVKFGAKRVHISRSGMVVSEGSACTAMDHFGRIIAST